MEMRLESGAFRTHSSSLHKNKSQTIIFLADGFAWVNSRPGCSPQWLEHFCFGVYHVHWLMFGSVPGLYLLETSNIPIPYVLTTKHFSRHCSMGLGSKIPPRDSHWFRGWFRWWGNPLSHYLLPTSINSHSGSDPVSVRSPTFMGRLKCSVR